MNRRGFLGRLGAIGLALTGIKLSASKAEPVRNSGEVILHPKKMTCLIKAPNELLWRADCLVTNRSSLQTLTASHSWNGVMLS